MKKVIKVSRKHQTMISNIFFILLGQVAVESRRENFFGTFVEKCMLMVLKVKNFEVTKYSHIIERKLQIKNHMVIRFQKTVFDALTHITPFLIISLLYKNFEILFSMIMNFQC